MIFNLIQCNAQAGDTVDFQIHVWDMYHLGMLPDWNNIDWAEFVG